MAYTPAAGADPLWDAYMAQRQAREAAARTNLEFANQTTDANAARQVEGIGRQAARGRVTTGANQRLRGVYNSSTGADARRTFEEGVDRSVGEVQSAAELAKQQGQMSYAQQLADMYAQTDVEAANSAIRLRDQEDKRRSMELAEQQARDSAARIAEQTQIAQLAPGIDFAGLAQMGQPQPPAPPAPAASKPRLTPSTPKPVKPPKPKPVAPAASGFKKIGL